MLSLFAFSAGSRLLRFGLSLVLISFLGVPLVAQAKDDQSESIRQYATTVTVDKDGRASFSETITYYFDTQRHGIYRDVPTVGQLPDGRYLVSAFSLDRVLRDGRDEPYTGTNRPSDVHLKVGSASQTIAGEHTYQLDYSLRPVVRHDEGSDYLSLNFVGTAWTVPVEAASASLVLPDGLVPTQTACYTGYAGSRESACTVTLRGSTLAAQVTRDLAAGEGLTVDVSLPEGSFNPGAYQEPTTTLPDATGDFASRLSLGALIISLIWPILIASAVLGVFIFSLVRRLHRHRRRAAETVVPYYEAPDGLLPAEVGLLTDDAVSHIEVTATLIHLATRGHLSIGYEEQKKFLFGKKQRFKLTRHDTKDALTDFEQLLMTAIFTADSVYVDELTPSSLQATQITVRRQLTDRLVKLGFYETKPGLFDLDRATDAGIKEWAKVEGLKLYLSVAEKDRMAFSEAPDKTPKRFTKLLPYAIALGVEAQWARQFAAIDVAEATRGWYSGNDGLNSVVLANTLAHSFAPAVAAAVTPPSSSSGGFSGGSSGGGSGGGGGGSW